MKLPLHRSCSVLKADPCGLVAVDKAAGVLSHPNRPSDRGKALLNTDYDPETEAYHEADRRWFLLNRLDAPTSGVILLADQAEVADAVRAELARHAVRKVYAAVVKGIPPRSRDLWRDCLRIRKVRGTLRTEPVRGRPDSTARMELLQRGSGPPARALIALHPETGRTHQLRVQCASRRLPIVGDATYGDFEFNRQFRRRTGENRLFLHSWKTSLEIRVAGQEIRFSAESPLPAAFTVALS